MKKFYTNHFSQLQSQTNHKYHLVVPSPWPIFRSLGGFCLTIGGVLYMHKLFKNKVKFISFKAGDDLCTAEDLFSLKKIGNLSDSTINNLITPNKDLHWINFAVYSHGNFLAQIEEQPCLLVIHDSNFYINISIWFKTSKEMFLIFESNFFQKILSLHEQIYGPQTCGWWYVRDSALFLHPMLAGIFGAAAHKHLYKLIFPYKIGRQRYLSPNFSTIISRMDPIDYQGYYLQLLSYLPRNLKNGHFEIKIKGQLYQIPNYEFALVNFIKNNFQVFWWLNFKFKWAFFIFKSGNPLAKWNNTRNVFFGMVIGDEFLSSKLSRLKKKYLDFTLVFVIKFDQGYNGHIWDFNDYMSEKFKTNENKPTYNLKRNENINGSTNISDFDLKRWVLDQYYLSSNFCSLCPEEYIQRFNLTNKNFSSNRDDDDGTSSGSFNLTNKDFSSNRDDDDGTSWGSFNFPFAFFCVRFKSAGNENKLFYGVSNNKNLETRLKNLKRSVFKAELLYLIKFNNEENLLNFTSVIVKKLEKLGKPVGNIHVYDLKGFVPIYDKQIHNLIFSIYSEGVYFCSMCPQKYIDNFNKNNSNISQMEKPDWNYYSSSWDSFNFRFVFFCVRFKSSRYGNKLYYGISNNINLDVRLKSLKKSCFKGQLLYLIKFTNQEDLLNFTSVIVTELNKLSVFTTYIYAYQLKGFFSITDQQIGSLIFSIYDKGVYSCEMCPQKYIDTFNESKIF